MTIRVYPVDISLPQRNYSTTSYLTTGNTKQFPSLWWNKLWISSNASCFVFPPFHDSPQQSPLLNFLPSPTHSISHLIRKKSFELGLQFLSNCQDSRVFYFNSAFYSFCRTSISSNWTFYSIIFCSNNSTMGLFGKSPQKDPKDMVRITCFLL